MSNTPEYQAAPATNKPVSSKQGKNVPPINGQPTDNNPPQTQVMSRGKRVMRGIQSLTIIIALILSAYSYTVIDSLNESESSVASESYEVLVRTEGRDADHICSAGGADIPNRE